MFSFFPKIFRRRLARLSPGDLPEMGRSSVETTTRGVGNLNAFTSVAAPFDLRSYDALETLWATNPDFSQAIGHLKAVGNTGHDLIVSGAPERLAAQIVARLNETSRRVWPHGGGVDGLINQYLISLAVFGAISSEDWIDLKARQVRRVVTVPVSEVRFVWDAELEDWAAYQEAFDWSARGRRDANRPGLIRLHPETFRYLAAEVFQRTPYAKPPALAVLEIAAGAQSDALANLRRAMNKQGLLGITTVEVEKPVARANSTETPDEFERRKRNFLAQMRDVVEEGLAKSGLAVFFRGQRIEHVPLTGDTGGFERLNNLVEQQMISAIGLPPYVFGRNDATTEALAEVMDSVVRAKAADFQRLARARVERTWRMDLLLGGIQAEVSLRFNHFEERRPVERAQAEEIRFRVAVEKVRAGLITPEQGAQELGYDFWADPARLLAEAQPSIPPAASARNRIFRFDRLTARYEYRAPEIVLSATHAALTEREIDDLLEKYIRQYLGGATEIAEAARAVAIGKIRAFLAQSSAGDFRDAEDFAAQLTERIQEAFGSQFDSAESKRMVAKQSEAIYEFYRLRDGSPFDSQDKPPIALTLGGPDRRALNFFKKIEGFYFGRHLDNGAAEIRNFLADEYLARGAALFGRGTLEDVQAFREAADGKLKNVSDRYLKIVVHQAVQRIRNWGHLNALRQGKFKFAVIVATLDARTTPICQSLNGKKIRVGVAAETIDRFAKMEPGEYAAAAYETEAAKEFRKDPVGFSSPFIGDDGVIDDQLVRAGLGFPPFHINCRSRVRGEF